MVERKLDIFRVLDAADAKDEEFFRKLTDEERKGLQPFLISRWMSGTSNAAQIVLINEFLNPYAFSLTRHKELLWQLLTVVNSGRRQRYVWNKLPAKRESGKPNALRAVREYYKYSTRDAVDALEILSRDQVINLAEQLGWQPDDIAKIKRELKVGKETDDTEKPVKKGKKATPVDNLLEY
jgi:hypothetical protein